MCQTRLTVPSTENNYCFVRATTQPPRHPLVIIVTQKPFPLFMTSRISPFSSCRSLSVSPEQNDQRSNQLFADFPQSEPQLSPLTARHIAADVKCHRIAGINFAHARHKRQIVRSANFRRVIRQTWNHFSNNTFSTINQKLGIVPIF